MGRERSARARRGQPRPRPRAPRDYQWREDEPARGATRRLPPANSCAIAFAGRDVLLVMEARELVDNSIAVPRRKLERLAAESARCPIDATPAARATAQRRHAGVAVVFRCPTGCAERRASLRQVTDSPRFTRVGSAVTSACRSSDFRGWGLIFN